MMVAVAETHDGPLGVGSGSRGRRQEDRVDRGWRWMAPNWALGCDPGVVLGVGPTRGCGDVGVSLGVAEGAGGSVAHEFVPRGKADRWGGIPTHTLLDKKRSIHWSTIISQR